MVCEKRYCQPEQAVGYFAFAAMGLILASIALALRVLIRLQWTAMLWTILRTPGQPTDIRDTTGADRAVGFQISQSP